MIQAGTTPPQTHMSEPESTPARAITGIPGTSYTLTNLNDKPLVAALRKLCDELEAGTLVYERGGLAVDGFAAGATVRGELILKRKG